ncbi:MAG: saccharopine dehydrogenase NADP-binding domain-containing protein [Chloroflexota bacterium]
MTKKNNSPWLLYGAYGFTGRLLVAEAVRRGHRPVLAGRDAARLDELGAQYDLDWLALDLDYAPRLHQAVERFDLVFHAAGPFIHTSESMIRACLAGGAHYIDITGEINVFENTFSHDAEARTRGVALMSGGGFDIVPTDCLARYVADQMPDATHLETAFYGMADLTSGTVKSALANLDKAPGGSVVRRNNRLVSQPLGKGSRKVRFSDGREHHVSPFPWGDLVAAAHTTGIPNITCYIALPRVPGMRWTSSLLTRVLATSPARRVANRLADWAFSGPDEEAQRTARTYLYARALNGAGQSAEAWLETGEVYRFTALAGIQLVERMLSDNPAGAVSPAGAFGADFVLGIEETRRFDNIPERA